MLCLLCLHHSQLELRLSDLGSDKFASLGSILSCTQISSFRSEHVCSTCVTCISSSHFATCVRRVGGVWFEHLCSACISLSSSLDFAISVQTSLLCLGRPCLTLRFRNFGSNTFAAVAPLVTRTHDVISRFGSNTMEIAGLVLSRIQI